MYVGKTTDYYLLHFKKILINLLDFTPQIFSLGTIHTLVDRYDTYGVHFDK